MKDSKGALVCEPLKHGVGFCKMNLQPFHGKPTRVKDPLLFFLDFETSGLDILTDHIVEIGVLCEHSECFSTVICPPVFKDGPAVQRREAPSVDGAKRRPLTARSAVRYGAFGAQNC
jgi:hypothetical protein